MQGTVRPSGVLRRAARNPPPPSLVDKTAGAPNSQRLAPVQLNVM